LLWSGGCAYVFDLAYFAGLEAEGLVEAYEHEWRAFACFFGSVEYAFADSDCSGEGFVGFESAHAFCSVEESVSE